MRILYLNPPYRPNYIRSARSTWPSISGSNWYPIFLAYAAGWGRVHGHTVHLLDALVEGLDTEGTLARARAFRPDMVVLYVADTSLEHDLSTARALYAALGCRIVAVGPWAAPLSARILTGCEAVECVVTREFDDAVVELAAGTRLSAVRGIVYRRAGKPVATGERPFLTAGQLDEFPFVTEIYREFLPLDRYKQASLLSPYVDMFTSRGCVWGKCTFCLWPSTIQKGAGVRMRSMERVGQELMFIKRELPQVSEVFFQDDTLPLARARELSEWMLSHNLRLPWSCYARATADYDTMRLMKRAGCRFIHVGYESGDDAILKTINKGVTVQQMLTFTGNAKRAGLRIHGDFIVGLPGETEASVKRTVAFAKSLDIEGYQFFTPQPQPGTPLHAWATAGGHLDANGVYSIPGADAATLERWRYSSMRQLYLTPRYIAGTLAHSLSAGELYRLVRTAFHVLPAILTK